MAELNQKGTIRIYGCGGCGVNNTGYFNKAADEPNCAHVKTGYIDASRSNLRPEFDDEDIFILPNVDGSGKVRKENHKEISNVIKQIILQQEPGDFNVVVFSASGGSGSVIGPLLLGELLERGKTAVCIVVGSDESIITATNTMNTLKSLEAISKRTEQPVVMFYEHNERERKRADVDMQVRLAISTMTVLANRRNREIDTKDISNWVQFSKTTTVKPQLAHLEIFTKTDLLDDIKDPISIASIYANEDVRPIGAIPEYHAAGYLTETSDQFEQLHFVISLEGIPGIYGTIKKTLDQYHTQRDSRAKFDSILEESDSTTDDGLVL